jgi:hypothetical protein
LTRHASSVHGELEATSAVSAEPPEAATKQPGRRREDHQRSTASRTKETGLAHRGEHSPAGSIGSVESSRATHEREFEQWVRRRLAQWPTMRIVQFEAWLREREAYEFVPAVHETLRRRGIDADGGNVRVRERIDARRSDAANGPAVRRITARRGRGVAHGGAMRFGSGCSRYSSKPEDRH